jgi:hypothetical protein
VVSTWREHGSKFLRGYPDPPDYASAVTTQFNFNHYIEYQATDNSRSYPHLSTNQKLNKHPKTIYFPTP